MSDKYVKTHLEMKYFVLKPKGNSVYNEASRRAMSAYADHIEEEAPEFAKALTSWAIRETLASQNEKLIDE